MHILCKRGLEGHHRESRNGIAQVVFILLILLGGGFVYTIYWTVVCAQSKLAPLSHIYK
jgi:hypothetical protein